MLIFKIKRNIVRSLILSCAVIVGNYANTALAEQQKELPSLVNQLIPDLMNKHKIPGMAVAIAHNNKDYFFEFGVQDPKSDTAVSENTLFEVGSISKLFTATLAAKAQVEGVLSLDSPISTYMSELANTPLGKVPLFHLATHTAGGFPLQLPNNVNSQTSLIKYYQNWQPKYSAGSKRSYANPSIGLLGMLTAKAKKGEFTNLMKKELLSPIGLNNTYINIPQTALLNYAWGTNHKGKSVRVTPALLANEAYGIKTTSKNLLQFLKQSFANTKNSSLINQAIRNTHISRFDTGPFHQALIWDKYQFPIDYCKLEAGNSSKMVFKDVPVTPVKSEKHDYKYFALSKTGSTYGFGAYVFAIPHKNFAIVMLANKSYPNNERIKVAYQIMAKVLNHKINYCD